MIKIRSTEKLATSNSNGLCDVLREMSSFEFDLEKNMFKAVVKDYLFQEKIVSKRIEVENKETSVMEVVERKIIEERLAEPWFFDVKSIDDFYQKLGVPITKTKGFTAGVLENLTTVLMAQTAQSKRQTMQFWVPDTDHVIVNKFSE